MYDLDTLRQEEFPHADETVYLNHAGISPLPQRTARRVDWVTVQLATNPNKFFHETYEQLMIDFGDSTAKLLNAASAAEIVAGTTTSSSLNAVAAALPLSPGDNIIFCDLEFPSNAYPWMNLVYDGIEPRCVPAEGGGLTIEAVMNAADERTAVVAVSALQFFSGHRTDLAAIGQFCHDNGILFIVDAIQSIGHMTIDVQAMHIDVLASGGMKSLMALPGVGILYVRDSLAEQMRPRGLCGNATVDYLHWLDYNLTPLPGASRFAAGTPNLPGIFSVISSLSLLEELGLQNIDDHTASLSLWLVEELQSLGYSVVTSKSNIGPIVTFRSGLDADPTAELVERLAERGVEVTMHLDKVGAAYLRASLHCYNTQHEVARFVEILQELV